MTQLNLQDLLGSVFNHVRGMWRYRWWANGIAWLLFAAGWLYVSTIPDVYRASTRVFVDTHGLLKPLMQGLTASQNPLDEVQLVSTAVLARPNLEKVANETDLVLRTKTPGELENLVTRLQRAIRISGGRDNIFRIEYEDVSREKARDVVTAVLDAFVENSLGNEGNDAALTERALSGEIAVHEQRLRDAEEKLAQFKQANVGYMPGEYGDYYNRMQTSLDNVSQAREKIRIVVERRDELNRQVQGEEPVFGIMPESGAARACSQAGQIQQLEGELAKLLVDFTDKHPRVVALHETITNLEAQCSAETPSETSPAAGPKGGLELNPVYQSLRIQLSAADVELVQLRGQLTAAEAQVAKLRQDVDKITEVEAQLKQLNRDYDVVQARHQELLRRWEDFQAKKRLDPVTDSGLFRKIEPPFALAQPVAPNRALLLAAVLVFAIGGGIAVAFGLNQLHPVFYTRNSLRRAAKFPVLGSISMILTPEAQARRRVEAIAWGGAYGVLLIFSTLAILFSRDVAALFRSLSGGFGA